jgi:hypothetical protein
MCTLSNLKINKNNFFKILTFMENSLEIDWIWPQKKSAESMNYEEFVFFVELSRNYPYFCQKFAHFKLTKIEIFSY